MQLHVLNDELWFPKVTDALPDGLLALGGDLSVDRLLLAYKSGIFPWFDDNIPLWWSPDPRFVLFPEKLKISKSMKQLLKKQRFDFTVDTAFEEVIAYCKKSPRKDQDGTWITDDMIRAYTELHQLGYAHSAEAWENGKLVGGLYGLKLGSAFFGESMFTNVSNASKYAFIKYVQQLEKEGTRLIDCQVYTDHLESLGAEMIPRTRFINMVSSLVSD